MKNETLNLCTMQDDFERMEYFLSLLQACPFDCYSFVPASDMATATSEYLRTLPSIRERCSKVFALGQQNKLEYFTYHPEKEADAVQYCTEIIKVSDARCIFYSGYCALTKR